MFVFGVDANCQGVGTCGVGVGFFTPPSPTPYPPSGQGELTADLAYSRRIRNYWRCVATAFSCPELTPRVPSAGDVVVAIIKMRSSSRRWCRSRREKAKSAVRIELPIARRGRGGWGEWGVGSKKNGGVLSATFQRKRRMLILPQGRHQLRHGVFEKRLQGVRRVDQEHAAGGQPRANDLAFGILGQLAVLHRE